MLSRFNDFTEDERRQLANGLRANIAALETIQSYLPDAEVARNASKMLLDEVLFVGVRQVIDEIELIPGVTNFVDFGGVFAKLPMGAIFASHSNELHTDACYTYDPYFQVAGVESWVVKTPLSHDPGSGWKIIIVKVVVG